MGNLENIAVEQVRVNAAVAVAEPKPRRRAGRKTEYLPQVEWGWFCRMAALKGKAGWVGLAIYRKTVMRKSATVTFCCRQLAEQLGINRKAVGYAMSALEAGGFIRARRGRGSYATVELLVAPEV
ncbi:MAG TPA: hypothetical protein VN612_03990 [Acidobacteriaceae bacterium]|nr:hypothetical protein [Acidobacteriaceae bacterium]